MASKEKNIGIEIMRIVSMLMVLFLHVLGQGGVYPYAAIAENHPQNFPVAWLLETASFGAVDLFALISGYVGYKSKLKASRYLKTWLLVSFWGVMIVLSIDKFPIIYEKFNEFIGFIIPSVKTEIESRTILPEEYLYALFPVSNNQYWYFNAYTLAYFATPIVNRAIGALKQSEHFAVCIGIFILTSIIPSISNADLFVIGYGYSAIWLILLYIIGAYIAKYPPNIGCCNRSVLLMGYFFCTAFAWQWMLRISKLAETAGENSAISEYKYQFIQYTSPFILAGAVMLLIGASQIKIKTNFIKKSINFVSEATFAVYIIHVQPIFWSYYMLWRFCKIGYNLDTLEMVYYVCVAVLILFAVCIILERIRMLLFKLLQIDKLTLFIGNSIDSLISKLLSAQFPEAVLEGSSTSIAESEIVTPKPEEKSE